jgi:hypothetical protein
MIFGLILLFAIYLLYLLLIKGFLWKLIIFVGGWVGIYVILKAYIPEASKIAITIAGSQYSWAAVIPTIICILCLAHTES